ncbi:MAG: GH3 auxin-responsive promoter family protein, partial [Caldilineaceae bacterium]|nr:GH3 auxin-responsive promoter family protein [Caldilineaceae bacterium]
MAALFIARLAWFSHGPPPGRSVQRRLLLTLLRANVESDFGRSHDFATIRTIADYQQRVPLSTYADYADAVTAIGDGRIGPLTAEPVRLLEPTSGSTSATKLIPYTDTLKRQFQAAIAPWVVSALANDPRLLTGPAYWSVSPRGAAREPFARWSPHRFRRRQRVSGRRSAAAGRGSAGRAADGEADFRHGDVPIC